MHEKIASIVMFDLLKMRKNECIKRLAKMAKDMLEGKKCFTCMGKAVI